MPAQAARAFLTALLALSIAAPVCDSVQVQETPGGFITDFYFLRDQIGFEPYAGCLKGSNGVLAEGAGNSLDRALLLQKLLEEKGFKCRLLGGRLSERMLRRLAERVAGSPVCEPGADVPQPYELLREHFWLQVQSQGGWISLDSSLSDSQPGQSIASLLKVYEALPSFLCHRLEITLSYEFEASGKRASTRVLRFTGLTRDLALDTPVLVFLARDEAGEYSGGAGPLFFPTLMVADSIEPARNLPLEMRRAGEREGSAGADFAIKSVWMDAVLKSPGASERVARRLLYSDARPEDSRLGEMIVFHISFGAVGGGPERDFPALHAARSMLGSAEAAEGRPADESAGSVFSAQSGALGDVADTLAARLSAISGRFGLAPAGRAFRTGATVSVLSFDPAKGLLKADLLTTGVRFHPAAGGAALDAVAANFCLGVSATYAEAELLSSLFASAPPVIRGQAESIAIGPEDIGVLDVLGLEPEQKRVMAEAAAAGKVLIVPQAAGAGDKRFWWEIDPLTGRTKGMLFPVGGGAVQEAPGERGKVTAAYAGALNPQASATVSGFAAAAAAARGSDAAGWLAGTAGGLRENILAAHSVISRALGRNVRLRLDGPAARLFSQEGEERIRTILASLDSSGG